MDNNNSRCYTGCPEVDIEMKNAVAIQRNATAIASLVRANQMLSDRIRELSDKIIELADKIAIISPDDPDDPQGDSSTEENSISDS